MALQQIKKVIIHDAIIENILRYVEENNLQIGDRIPSERTLAACMNVSRSSVRGAVKALEFSGMLEVRHGGGAYLRAKNDFSSFKYGKHQKENLVLLRHLIDARRMIEERVVTMVTPIITPEQVRRLYDMEEYQVSLIESGAEVEGSRYELPNMNFELAITAMLENPVILDMHQRLETAWKKAFRNLATTPFPARERYNHHIGIIQAMEKKNVKKAEKAMEHHNRILVAYIDEEIRKLDDLPQDEIRGSTVAIPAR
jgi:GntR family transcriptional repressor for pyruvate dehydrogenase complex